MKNAKRLLAMVLAIAMVMSFVVIPASAEENVIVLQDGIAQQITISAGSSVTVQVDASNSEMTLTVDGQRTYWNFNVQAGVQTYTAGPTGAAVVELPQSENAYTLTINNTSTDAEVVLNVTAAGPVFGTQDNPAPLSLDEVNVAEVEADSWTGYFFTWTAEMAGVLTVAVDSTYGWMYSVNNVTAGIYGDSHWSDDEPVVSTSTVNVSAGDTVIINVNTYTPNEWSTPAGSINVTASFEHVCNWEYNAKVDPFCHNSGMEAYYYCAECDIYAVEDDNGNKINTNPKNLYIPAENPAEYFKEVPACHEDGMKAHYYCAGCQNYFEADDNGNLVNSNRYNLVIPAIATLQYNATIEATAHTTGIQEHWYCAECDGYFVKDEAGNPITIPFKRLTIPATHDVVYNAGYSACHNDGLMEHYYCADCDSYFTLINGNLMNTNLKNLTIPADENALVYFEAVEAGCHDNGNVEYWYCSGCDCYFEADDNGNLINSNAKNVVIPAENTLVYNEEVPACHENGLKAHYYCAGCDCYFEEVNGNMMNTNRMSLTIPATATLETVAAVEPTCHENGNIEYSYCDGCDTYFVADDNGNLINTNAKSVILPATALEYTPAVEACHNDGMMAYWYCSNCDVYFTEVEGNLVNTAYLSLVIPGDASKLVEVEAVEPTCHENGNIAYSYCADCDCYFTADENGNLINTNAKSVILPATSLEYVAELPACHQDGIMAHYYCSECDAYFTMVEGNLVNTNLKNLTIEGNSELLEKVEAVEATCHENGNIEYYYCAGCDSYFVADDNGNLIPTNAKSVIVPATDLEYYAAVESCHQDGNLAYWYCSECDVYFVADENGNLVNVARLSTILPGDGKLLYVPAVAPTVTANGNVAYFYCDVCNGYYTLDNKGNMVNSNALSVILPATGYVDVDYSLWYGLAINYVTETGLMNGTGVDTFTPNGEVSRAMVWTVLGRMAGETITGETWIEDAKAWAMEAGVSDGTNPEAAVTREQLVTMIYRFYNKPETNGDLSAFEDASSISAGTGCEDFVPAMTWAVENGVINGMTATTLAPQGTATRAQFAQILMNYLAG